MADRKRQQTEIITFRVIPEIKKSLESDAERAGLSLSGLVKFRACGDAAALMPSRQRRQPADLELLRQILGQLGRVGSNINQIAKVSNSTGDPQSMNSRALIVIAQRLDAMRSDLLTALGVGEQGQGKP